MNKYYLFLGFYLILLLPTTQLKAQEGFSGNIMLDAYYSGGDPLPFWMYSNKRGRVNAETSFSGLLQGQYLSKFDNGDSFRAKVGLLYRDNARHDIFFDEAYLEYTTPWFRISAGRRHRSKLYDGVSASNENILWSLNAPALPGLELETTETFYFNPEGKLGFEAMWGDYLLDQDRHVKNARVHRKYFRLVYRTDTNWKFKAGIQHFAQWGGVSPDKGEQPEAFTDYLKIVTGRGGGEAALQGDQENALGNHLGSWELYAEKEFRYHRIGFLFNNIFEDGSGSRFANFPDGRYGVYWERIEKNNGINRVMYEYYNTRDQSHDVNRWGADNYLGHSMTYNSGWTYQNRVLAAPFFLYDAEEDLIYNNKFSAHHLGISGQYANYWHTYPYKFIMSFAHNEGTFRNGIKPNEDTISFYAEGRVLPKPFELNLIGSGTYNNLKKPIYAVGLSLKKSF